MHGETQNQLSLSRAAFVTGQRLKKQVNYQ
jgi:hypothetical protein